MIALSQPMYRPPTRSIPETPKDPKLSTLPKPIGKRSEGALRLHETVARVRISEARSAILCQASATIALELKAHPPINLAMAMPKFESRPILVILTPGSFLFVEVR